MHTITFISTMHREIGNCNADQLLNIIKQISPEVIFLEALEDTYSKYDQQLFCSSGIFHHKLELKAIQLYNSTSTFEYIPVLDYGLQDSFEIKYGMIPENTEYTGKIEEFYSLAGVNGFNFLNSQESILLQDEMRKLENQILSRIDINTIANHDIDAYENSMIENIYKYCSNNEFETAIFMCGVGHRKSMIEKIVRSTNPTPKINWLVFNG
jgi:hypothetical protein